MASYVVMEAAGDRTGEGAIFIRDAFAPLAVILPVVWLLWHRLWLEAGIALTATLGMTAALEWLGVPQVAGLAALLTGLYVALEGSALRMAAARRKGFTERAVIDAASRDEAEEHHLLTRQTVTDRVSGGQPVSLGQYGSQAQNLGVFALPGSA